LWVDEGFTAWAVAQGYGDLWSVVPTFDQHPPLFHLLLKLWTEVFGDSEAALRGLPALAGVATVPLVWLAGRSLGGERDGARVGLTAAALFAVAPVQLQYAQEARAYALLTLAAAAAIAGALFLAARPDAARAPLLGWGGGAPGARLAWAGLVAGTGAALWLHNLAALLALALAAGGLVWLARDLRWDRRAALNLLLAAALVAVLWSPFLVRLLAQAGGVASGFWIPAPDRRRILGTLEFLFAVRFLDAVPMLWPLLALAALGLLALARRGRAGAAALLGAATVLPVALSLLASVAVQPILLGRTLVWTGVPFYLALASAPLLLPPGRARLRGALAAALVALSAAGSLRYFAVFEKEPWRELTAEIARGWRPGDLLVLAPGFLETQTGYYAPRVPGGGALRVHPLASAATVDDAGLDALRRALPPDGRAWLVLRGADRYDPAGEVRRLLEGQGRPLLAERRVFGRGLWLYLYGTPAPAEGSGPASRS
jgi:mannosyltransferase